MSINEFTAFEALDLNPIKMKLMHAESGEGWPALRAAAVEMEYRRFLFLMKKYPDAEASPTVDVDTFWHYHILDTIKYARDCEALFGYFLHHYPYVGIGEGTADSDRLSGGSRMRALHETEFGVKASEAVWFLAPGEKAAAAYCSSPGKKITPAYCSSPGKKSDTAYCTSPGKQVDGRAWSMVPGKQLQARPAAAAPQELAEAA